MKLQMESLNQQLMILSLFGFEFPLIFNSDVREAFILPKYYLTFAKDRGFPLYDGAIAEAEPPAVQTQTSNTSAPLNTSSSNTSQNAPIRPMKPPKPKYSICSFSLCTEL